MIYSITDILKLFVSSGCSTGLLFEVFLFNNGRLTPAPASTATGGHRQNFGVAFPLDPLENDYVDS